MGNVNKKHREFLSKLPCCQNSLRNFVQNAPKSLSYVVIISQMRRKVNEKSKRQFVKLIKLQKTDIWSIKDVSGISVQVNLRYG